MIVEQLQVGPMAVFCYIVGCEVEKKCALIDPGGNEKKILDRAKELGLEINSIINTHGHADHTCGNHAIIKKTGAGVIIHELDARDVANLKNKAFSLVLGKKPSPLPQRLVKDGNFIPIGQTGLEVIHTPGHTPGSICLYGEGNIFTGDTLFVDGVGRTDLKGGSFDTLLESLRKLISLPGETKVWPGHDYGRVPVSTIGQQMKDNSYIADFILG